jgi:hypothetical protein
VVDDDDEYEADERIAPSFAESFAQSATEELDPLPTATSSASSLSSSSKRKGKGKSKKNRGVVVLLSNAGQQTMF